MVIQSIAAGICAVIGGIAFVGMRMVLAIIGTTGWASGEMVMARIVLPVLVAVVVVGIVARYLGAWVEKRQNVLGGGNT